MARFSRFSRKPRFRRFGRFRRNRGVWFPTLGTIWDDGTDTYHDATWSDIITNLSKTRALGPYDTLGLFQGAVIPVTKDFTQLPSDTTEGGTSLRDFVEGQQWHLDRLVGNIEVSCHGTNTGPEPDSATVWTSAQVVAGFFLGRSDDTSGNAPDLFPDEYDPINTDNIQNPWIWRRSWILQQDRISQAGYSARPCSNQWMADGTNHFIDSKVKRRIAREHRLWFVIGAMGWNGNQLSVTGGEGISQPLIKWHLDLRVFGRMSRGRNPGTF